MIPNIPCLYFVLVKAQYYLSGTDIQIFTQFDELFNWIMTDVRDSH